jgi:hypothetical protein
MLRINTSEFLGKREFATKRRIKPTLRNLELFLRLGTVGRTTIILLGYATMGGQITHSCGGLMAGRQDAALNRKKCEHGCLRFFLPWRPEAKGWGLTPFPFELMMHGFVNGTTGATTERRECREQTHPFFLTGGGSPAARGRVYLSRHQTTAELHLAWRLRDAGWADNG